VEPLKLPDRTPGKNAYEALVLHVQANALNPHNFFAALHAIAGCMGKAQSTAEEQIALLERDRRLVVLDRGRKNECKRDENGKWGPVTRGRASSYALVLFGETVYDAIASAKATDPASQWRLSVPYAAADMLASYFVAARRIAALNPVAGMVFDHVAALLQAEVQHKLEDDEGLQHVA